MRHLPGGTQGQALVETAMTMPLTIFLMLGVIQIGLLTQGRNLVKYAAYRAARAGALHHACNSSGTGDPMKKAALAALVPLVDLSGENLLQAKDIGTFMASYAKIEATNLQADGVPIVDVRICGPLKKFIQNSPDTYGPEGSATAEVDFDDFQNNSDDGQSGYQGLENFERLRLRVQVRFYQKLIIPFAGATIWRIWQLQNSYASLMTAGMYKGNAWTGQTPSTDIGQQAGGNPTAESLNGMVLLAANKMHHYYMPIYGNYAFRMQSNLYLNRCPLPSDNTCLHYNEGTGP